ncbi:TFIIB-type zinc ribbon-containing protein [Cryptosporangium minutisporangium]
MICPKCQAPMRQYERAGVTIDQCSECRGIFLDRGELERLVDAEDKYRRGSHGSHGAPSAPPPAPGYPSSHGQPAYGQPGYGQPAYGQQAYPTHSSHAPGYGTHGSHGAYGHHGHRRHRGHRRNKSFFDDLFG